MFKRIFPIIFILSLILPFASCGGTDITAQEISANSIEASSQVSSYSFDVSMDFDMSVTSEGEIYSGFMTLDSSGKADTVNRKLQMDVNIDTEFTGQDRLMADIGMYVLDGSVYMKMNAAAMGFGDIWVKSEMPEESWKDLEQLEPQVELLKDAAQVILVGSETVDGKDCYVLEVTPDLAALWDAVMQQSTIAELTVDNVLPSIDYSFLEQVFKEFSLTQWIAKDNFLPVKGEMNMSLDITPEAIGYPDEEGQMNLVISAVTSISHYDEPVDIELPEAAQAALEIPIF